MDSYWDSHQYRVVEIDAGQLRGEIDDGVAVFKGIPYGQPTGGKNRFRGPQPVVPWEGVRDALQLGHPCIQDNPDFPAWLDPIQPDEDCLYLNVWAPAHARATAGLPVMVWLHGGGYVFGSGGAPLYDARHLARRGDVVVVSINHRLQAFGFTDLSECGDERFADAGNAGQLDIVAALEWVASNIAIFGGDPGNITLFGQSGGGAKILTLMAMPASTGLFHRAIIQSGSVFRYRTREEAADMSKRMFAILGIRENDIDALQALPADHVQKCGEAIIAEADGVGNPVLIYGPVVDGRVIPTMPWREAPPEGAEGISMIIGSTLEETIIYLPAEAREVLGDDARMVDEIVAATTTRTPDRQAVTGMLPAYRTLLPDADDMEIAIRLSTDLGFWRGALHNADLAVQAGMPVFMYRCEWKTPCFDGRWSPHSMEIPFVMGFPDYEGPAWDGQDTRAARDADDPEGQRYALSDRMMTAWVNFARHGDPSQDGLVWPAYDLDKRPTMIFDRKVDVVDDPGRDFRALLFPAAV